VTLSKHSAAAAGGGGDGDDHHTAEHHEHLRLPSPVSHVASRLQRLAHAAMSMGNWRAALLCYDLAGDAAGALRAVAACALVRELQARAGVKADDAAVGGGMHVLLPAEVTAALASLASSTASRVPGVSLVAAMRRACHLSHAAAATRKSAPLPAIAEALDLSPAVATAVSGLTGAAHPAALRDAAEDTDDDEDDGGSDDDRSSEHGDADSDAAEAARRAAVDAVDRPSYPVQALTRALRGESLLPAQYGIASSAAAIVARVSAAVRSAHVSAAFPDLAASPFLPLLSGSDLDGGLAAMAAEFADKVKPAAASAGPSATIIAHVPAPIATLYRCTVLLGGTANPAVPAPLPNPHIPLALDSLQRWMGSAMPKSVRLGRNAADGAGDGDGDGDEGDVLGLEGDLGNMLGAGSGAGDAVGEIVGARGACACWS